MRPPCELVERLRAEIAASGPLSFARFMERALYDVDHGYYSRGPSRLGRTGDFYTVSDVGSFFGACLARQLREIDGILGRPRPFATFEPGAGRGLLARDVIDTLRNEDAELAERLAYTVCDRSAGMREAASELVPEAEVVAPDDPRSKASGCVVAVELFDALPVHRVRRRNETLFEVRVDWDVRRGLVEVEIPAGTELREYAAHYGVAGEDGVEAEICLGAGDLLAAITAPLERGVVLIFDYGFDAPVLYDPERRGGTLLAYHRNQTNERFLDRVGEQDLTAHVNFSALEERARELGLRVLGRTTQDRFLIGNGILEVFETEDPDRWQDPVEVKRRLQVKQLINPQGMGRTFQLLALGRGLDEQPALSGLVDPFRREPR